MTSPLTSHTAYSDLIYGLLTDNSLVKSHTVAVYTVGQTVGMVRGEIQFHSGHTLRIFEQIDYLQNRILKYSYEVVLDGEKLWWYDPMPHPHIAELQTNHPHHKHVPPDIKHNRILALEISFDKPNLPFLVAEVGDVAKE